MPGPRVTAGDRVTLRTAEREDLPFLQRGATEPAVRYPLGSAVRTRDELERRYGEEHEGLELLACLDGPDPGSNPETVEGDPGSGETRPIGAVVVEGVDWKRPELSYWLAPDVHGEGYGRDAVAAAVDLTFRTRAVPAVEAGVYAFNDASRGLLESLGFVEEGRRRRHSFTDGEWADLVEYGLLREEWERGRGGDGGDGGT